MHAIAEILKDKGRDVLEIDAGATVLEAVQRMVERNVGSLLVRDGPAIAGIVTERDYLRHAAARGSDTTAVRKLMSSPLVVATPETPIDECMAIMTDRRIRHLPVVDQEGEVVGVVSIGDLVKFTSRLQSFELKYLTEFISAGTARTP